MARVLDILTYAQVPNPRSVPGVWPADCVEIDDAQPVTPGRTRMTLAQFATYKATHQAAYDTWRTTVHLPTIAGIAAQLSRQAARDSIESSTTAENKALRAIILAMLDEINALRTAAALSARTRTQLMVSIAGKLTDGSAD